jgi:hypothetical protein
MVRFKKSQVMDNVIGYLFKVVLIVVIFSVIVFLVRQGIKFDIDIFEIESVILASKLLYGANLLSYTDSYGKVYSGVIDMDKFSNISLIENVLNQGIYYTNRDHIMAKIEIVDIDGHIFGPVYLQRDSFNVWYPIALTKGKGQGGALLTQKSYYVLLKDRRQVRKLVLESLLEDKEIMRNWNLWYGEEYNRIISEEQSYNETLYVPGKMIITIIRPNS